MIFSSSAATESSSDAPTKLNQGSVGLLVSVRSAKEASIALQGGADLIDVKEPNRGSLGAAGRDTIEAVVRQVAGAVPVSVAMGELLDYETAWSNSLNSKKTGQNQVSDRIPEGVSFAKFGLAGCRSVGAWSRLWQDILGSLPGTVAPVAVIYADWTQVDSPPPDEILSRASELGCRAVLIDTFNKCSGALFDHFSDDSLRQLVVEAKERSMAVVLAGSLTESTLPRAHALGPACVAVRGAACHGDRRSGISGTRVRRLKQTLNDCEDRRADPLIHGNSGSDARSQRISSQPLGKVPEFS